MSRRVDTSDMAIADLAMDYIDLRRGVIRLSSRRSIELSICRSDGELTCIESLEPENDWCEHCTKADDLRRERNRLREQRNGVLRVLERRIKARCEGR